MAGVGARGSFDEPQWFGEGLHFLDEGVAIFLCGGEGLGFPAELPIAKELGSEDATASHMDLPAMGFRRIDPFDVLDGEGIGDGFLAIPGGAPFPFHGRGFAWRSFPLGGFPFGGRLTFCGGFSFCTLFSGSFFCFCCHCSFVFPTSRDAGSFFGERASERGSSGWR